MTQPSTPTQLLAAHQAGDHDAMPKLFEQVYDALYGMARRQRQKWQGDHTVSATALVNEAYLKLVDQANATYRDRAHFLAVAAQAMRHILIDYARRRQAVRRGGDLKRTEFDDVFDLSDQRVDELLDLQDALDQLAALQPRQAKVVECRLFGGMQVDETAQALGLSKATVKRDWAAAQALLYQHLQAAPE
ncbi:MAG: ECF-type sigma factor [Pseudomonadota bacterium]